MPSRTILRLDEVAKKTTLPVATHRYMRHIGTGPPTFRLGKHVVAFEDEVDSWIEEQAAAARSSS